MRRPVKIFLWSILALVLLAAGAAYVYYYFRSGGIPQVSIDKEKFPIKGVDVSSHNHDIDFARLVDDGVEFVYIKSTEGGSYKDVNFNRNYRLATKANLKVGVYHFFRFETDGEMQALNILHSIRGKKLDLPVAIDVEEWTNRSELPTTQIVERLNALIDYLKGHGYEVIIYTNLKGYFRFYRDRLEHCPLWLCSFRNPPIDDNRVKPLFWQYSHLGSVDGASGFIDLDTFYGDRAAWDAWLAKTTAQRNNKQ
ncbi:MAG: hypothetical protein J5784_05850 [Muribaculaceae bacterium]|nr:hypothetical protein [Muribaculaceae bacterium]MBR4722670.1 hypothetical protein [Muribaculaceae bacterium]